MNLDRAEIQNDLTGVAGGGIAIKVKTTHDPKASLTSEYWTDKGGTTKVPMCLTVTINTSKIRSPNTLDMVMDRLRTSVIEQRPPSDDPNHPGAYKGRK